jgi:hypothetical protein
MKGVTTAKVTIAQVEIPVHFSFDPDKLSRMLLRKYKAGWYPDQKVYGETADKDALETAEKFVAIWVNRAKHKTDLDTLQTINHEIEHAARMVVKLYGEEPERAEETTIRVSDFLRERLYKYLGINITMRKF